MTAPQTLGVWKVYVFAEDGKGKKGAATLDAFAESGESATPSGESAEPPKPRQAFLAKGSITMTNYMMGSKKFRFFVVIPDNAVFVEADPKPKDVKERYVAWDYLSRRRRPRGWLGAPGYRRRYRRLPLRLPR